MEKFKKDRDESCQTTTTRRVVTLRLASDGPPKAQLDIPAELKCEG